MREKKIEDAKKRAYLTRKPVRLNLGNEKFVFEWDEETKKVALVEYDGEKKYGVNLKEEESGA